MSDHRFEKTQYQILSIVREAVRSTLPDARIAYFVTAEYQAAMWDRIKLYAHLLPGYEVDESRSSVRFRNAGGGWSSVGVFVCGTEKIVSN